VLLGALKAQKLGRTGSKWALGALRHIVCDESYSREAIAAGAVRELHRLMQDGDLDICSAAVWALAALVPPLDCASLVVAEGALPALTACLRNGNSRCCENAAVTFVSISSHCSLQQAVAAAGCVPTLVYIVRGEVQHATHSAIREAAAVTLGNLACRNPEIRRLVLDTGALSALAKLIEDGLLVGKETAIRAVWAIMTDCAPGEGEKEVRTSGVAISLANVLCQNRNSDTSIRRITAACLLTLANGSADVQVDIMPVLGLSPGATSGQVISTITDLGRMS